MPETGKPKVRPHNGVTGFVDCNAEIHFRRAVANPLGTLLKRRDFSTIKQKGNVEVNAITRGPKLRDTQQVSLVLADATDFGTFFSKQVSFWGRVVRENNIRA